MCRIVRDNEHARQLSEFTLGPQSLYKLGNMEPIKNTCIFRNAKNNESSPNVFVRVDEAYAGNYVKYPLENRIL